MKRGISNGLCAVFTCCHTALSSSFLLSLLEQTSAFLQKENFLYMTGLHPGKALFVFFFLVTYLALNRGMASFMQVRFTRLPDSGLYGYSNGLLHLAVLAVTVSPILLLFRQTCPVPGNLFRL